MVPGAGIEPARRCQRGILIPLCLPISPLGPGRIKKIGGAFRSRTGLGGFAIRYITALLTRLKFGAGNETRTRDPNLGKVMLYQLSYSRYVTIYRLNAVHSSQSWQIVNQSY